VRNERERRNEKRELPYEIADMDPGAQHVASLFAGTHEQMRTAAHRTAPNLGQAPSALSPDRVGLYKSSHG